ncbi:type I polyketide synthase [Streptomyces sp. HU2014]|uniref:type I polyketide synthase n=1 Tax=Streptomyces sp. HU2014 TaxID=2939414 RepID=UPI0024B3A22C|nr:type I polyketide synthase [Streptomyces sp. HU2014]
MGRSAVGSGREIAITGIGCRLPGGLDSLDALWSALLQGRDLVTRMPAERFDPDAFTDADPRRPGRTYTTAAGVLDDIAAFDAEYFSLSPREAARMDPQQRLLLELAAEAVDDAGLDPAALAGTDTGVFVGVSNNSYGNLQFSRLETVDRHTMTGIASGNTAGRLAHALDLRGPGVAVDTACSSSLVALHQACAHLEAGGEAALAAGVNILVGPHEFIGFAKASMLSPTGRCRAFSAAADGFVRAEGGVVLVLRPLARALADGDRVHAVITATGTNSDGRTPGLAQPSARAQAALLRQVYDRAGLDPRELLYLEAHGTGTPVGDPLECEAVSAALAGRRSPGQPLPIGSVKTNLGHLESASGLAGLLKALLVLRHRVVPASLHGHPASPAIDFTRLRLTPVLAATPLATASGGLAGVNSFGFGGANAHAVLAPAPEPAARPAPPAGPRPVLVSARTPAALTRAATALADRLDTPNGTGPGAAWDFYDTAHTTLTRRGTHPYRLAVLAPDAPTAAARLRARAGTPPAPALARGDIAFVYSGNGAQWTGMGRRLLASSPAFREAVEEADAALTPLLGWSVRDELAAGTPDPARQALTQVAQPLLFTVQTALTAALAALGVHPEAVAGHSVGEIAAAHACGALGLAAAARVVAHRSSAQARTAGSGRMAAVGLAPDRARDELVRYEGLLELAAVNSPADVTIAGDENALDDLARTLAGRGTFFRMLELDHAFHTSRMDPVEDDLRAALAGLCPEPGRLPFASTVTGTLHKGEELTADYWWRNVRRPVLLPDAVLALAEAGCDAFVEIGPHPVLASYLRRTLATARPYAPAAVVPTLARDADGPGALEQTVAALLTAGARTDTGPLLPVPGRVRDLPAYPWQRERHWHGSPRWFGRGCGDGLHHHPLLGERTGHTDPLWQLRLDPSGHGWLADHVVGGAVVLPAAAFAETALAAGALHHKAPVQLEDLAVERALVLPFDDPAMDVRLQTALDPADGTVRLSSRDGTGPWRPHARGAVRRLLRERPGAEDVQALRARLTETWAGPDCYAAAARAGLAYGPAFTVLTHLHTGDGEVLARYALPAPAGRPATSDTDETGRTGPGDGTGGHLLHPAVLDGLLQAGLPLLARAGDSAAGTPYLPVAIEALRVWDEAPAEGWAHVREREATRHEVRWDVRLLDDRGRVVAEADGCRLRRFDTGRAAPARLAMTLRAAPRDPGPDLLPAPRLPAPRELARAAVRAPLPAWDAGRYAHAARLSEELSAHFTLRAAHTLAPDAAAYTPDSLVAAGALPGHRRLLRALLGQAERAGLARRTADGAWAPTGPADPAQVLSHLFRAAPGYATETVLHSRCGTRLAEVLLGRTDPMALLFADAERHWVENLFSVTGVTRYCNALAVALVRETVRHWPAGRPLRVLEAGGGTGALTSALLDVLPADRAHYTFTDVSEAFFPRARHRFTGHDHLVYRTLDLDRDLQRQGFTARAFDLVVAGNVLHATTDLRATLTRVAGLLDDGGQLLAVETHNPDRLMPYFGLLRSFWNDGDLDLRPDSPLLGHDRWPELLTAHGFDETAQLGADQAGGDYSVLLARRGPGADTAVRGAGTAVPDGRAAREVPAVPVALKDLTAPAVPDALETPAVPEKQEAPEALGAPDVLDTPAVPQTRDTPEGLDAPGAPAALDGRSAPGAPAERVAPGHATSWILVTEHPGPADPFARTLADALRAAAAGSPVTVVGATTDPAVWTSRLRSDEDRPAVVLLATEDDPAPDPAPGPVHGRGDDPGDGRAALTRAVTRTAVLRALAQACAGLPRGSAPELWLLTHPSGALPAPEPGAPLRPHGAVPWAVARTLANEQPRLSVRRLSYEPGPTPAHDARRLVRELLAPTEDDETVLTSAGRFVPRLRELPAVTDPAGDRPYRLRLRRPGSGFALDWVPAAPPAPGPGQVTVEVRAAGLNYRDVMLAAGSLPPGAESPVPGEHSLGLECAGVVTALGEGTSRTVGERVFAYAPGALASHVVVPEPATGRIPAHLDFAEAATLPVAFFTVQHALEHLARLAEGETVLVHGAAGGVGLAALQYARHVGARVVATAGGPAKRDLLALLGADHVLDSRTLAFADRIMELTGGAGVDVVLNSLAGEALTRGLDVLRPGGRFVELGKRDIHTGGRIPLRAFRDNLSFHAVDAHRMHTRQPKLSATHFAELTRRVHQGVYRPLPHQVLPTGRVGDAFALLRRSHHVGKVVVGFETAPRLTPPPARLVCDPAATYLITGGLTGLGASTAHLLADRGARHLALVSRRGPATPGAPELIAALARKGVTATAHAADAAEPGELSAVLDAIAGTGRPLRGVLHSAMALADALLVEASDEDIEAVLAPKLRGAAVLDALTRGTELDFFVTHSSISASVGHRAQAAYAAANLSMEALVRARRAAGLPGLAVGWGLLGEVGSGAGEEIGQALERMGLAPMRTDHVLTALEELMTRPGAGGTGDAAVVQVGHFDFARMATLLPTLRAPRFAAVLPPEDAADPGPGARPSRAEGGPPPGRAELAGLLVRLVARVTHRAPEKVDRDRRLDALGLDSLMATELVVALQRELGCEVPAMDVVNADSIDDLAGRVLTLLDARTGGP